MYNNTANESFPSEPPTEERFPPFLIQVQHFSWKGKDTPDHIASVLITRTLRTSGLLQFLPAQEFKLLLLMFTFLTPDGHCQPTLQQLAHALQVSEDKTRRWMQRLTQIVWQGERLVIEVRSATGLEMYEIAPMLYRVLEIEAINVRLRSADTGNEIAPVDTSEGPMSIREAIIAHSRAKYGRPREMVERELAAFMGWPYPFGPTQKGAAEEVKSNPNPNPSSPLPSPEEAERARLRRQLLALDVTGATADELLSRFDVERIRHQLEWLPHRKAKSPARFLLAAIEGDYEAPPALRTKKAVKSSPQKSATDSTEQ